MQFLLNQSVLPIAVSEFLHGMSRPLSYTFMDSMELKVIFNVLAMVWPFLKNQI